MEEDSTEAAQGYAPKKGKSKGGPSAPAPKAKGKGEGRAKLCEELHTACQFDDIDALQKIFEQTPELDVNQMRANRGVSPLHTAAGNGSTKVVEVLLQRRANVEAANHWKETSLHVAANAGHETVAAQLLDARANIEAADSWTRTPLRVALEQGSQAAAQILRDSGAVDVDPGTLPADAAIPPPDCSQRQQHEKLAAELAWLLKDRPAKPAPEPVVKHMFKSSTSTPSDAEAQGNKASAPPSNRGLSKFIEYPANFEAIQRLLGDSTVDPAGRDMFGLTALHKFAAWDRVDLIEELLPYLSTDEVNATGGDDGFSALHHAVSMGAVHSIAALLNDSRVSRDTVDKTGRTASVLAKETPGLESVASMIA